MRAIAMGQGNGFQPHALGGGNHILHKFDWKNRIAADPVECHDATLVVGKTSLQDKPGYFPPEFCSFFGIEHTIEHSAGDRRQRSTQVSVEQQFLQAQASKLPPTQNFVDPGDANSIQASQVHDPEVLAEMRLPHKEQIAAVTPLDPFVDDRGNVIDVVVVAEKKECFHGGAGRRERLRANESFYMNGCCVPIAGWPWPQAQSCPPTPGIAGFAAIASRAPVV